MPHNLFLHSEVIQSRQWNLQDDKIIKKQLKYEFFDTLFSMLVGFLINSAMILLAAATFFRQGLAVDALEQAQSLLSPMLGPSAGLVPLPGQGPLLTTRPLAASPPPAASWTLTLGDIELF